jgi:hypothetical protein
MPARLTSEPICLQASAIEDSTVASSTSMLPIFCWSSSQVVRVKSWYSLVLAGALAGAAVAWATTRRAAARPAGTPWGAAPKTAEAVRLRGGAMRG